MNAQEPVSILVLTGSGNPSSSLLASLGRLHARGQVDLKVYTRGDVEAGGRTIWARWMQDIRPVTVIIARQALPGDEVLVRHAHNRGVAVAYAPDATPPNRHGLRFEQANAWLAEHCDAILPPADKQEAAADERLLYTLTVEARRTVWEKLLGSLRRLPARAAWVARGLALRVWREAPRDGDPKVASLRILFVANSFLPTLQLCFTRPLQPFADADRVAWEVLADIQLTRIGRVLSFGRHAWAARRLRRFRPDLVVFCRYSGAHAVPVTDWARKAGVPTIFHLDDDLLDVPLELGAEKFAFHNRPERLQAVRHLMQTCDQLYCSTATLLDRMRQHGFSGWGVAGQIHCSAEVLKSPVDEAPLKIGYMGIDHSHDFQVALPALIRILERYPQVRFEIFGPIATPPALQPFGNRVSRVGFVRSYDGFLSTLASLGWAIGICPLAETNFNRYKANNKWVEYTAAGIATVATAGMVYNECCAGGCGELAGDDRQWETALQSLIDDPSRRLRTVAAAQAKLRSDYSPMAHRSQLLEIFRSVFERSANARPQVASALQIPSTEVACGD